MDALKDMFGPKFYEHLAAELKRSDPGFKVNDFLNGVLTDLDERSLNQRMRQTSVILERVLPHDFEKTLQIFKKVIPKMAGGYTNLVFPDYVGLFGYKQFDLALDALKYFTQFGSSEFAIREFLKRDFLRTIKVMGTWSQDKNVHVRRLASEGSRPRLPWSFKLDEVIKDPTLTRSILENLKADNELYVRKSVANHLNDVSKENPDYMLRLVGSWDQKDPNTLWIIKHASRSLIKKGHSGTLKLFEFEKNPKIKVANFELSKQRIKMGSRLEFEFELISESNKPQKLVVDYIIHYLKKNGQVSPKVFKLKELSLGKREKIKIKKRQLFQDFTTRKHYMGKHTLSIQVNGKVVSSNEFNLVK